jgi:hypothetical protein
VQRPSHRPQVGHDRHVANGKPGDHPLTDILHWNHEVFGRDADDLIREIVRLGGSEALERPPLDLVTLDPRYNRDVDLPALEGKLRELRDTLRANARERGWEVD